MIALAAAHATLLILLPIGPVIAIGLWWNANTISHNFIHRPFFRRRSANRLFAAGLSLLLGIPYVAWRDRHLAHHAGRPWRLRVSGELAAQTALVLTLWTTTAWLDPRFFGFVYLPAYATGLFICAVHGHYEHAVGTISHYGRLYNLLFFNDGYHVEHHRHPSMRWNDLVAHRAPDARVSRWPAPLRWIELDLLLVLERVVLHSRLLQWFVLRSHLRAFRAITGALPPIHRIAIVGGGLFPRTARIARTLWPQARLTIIDANRANLDRARAELPPDDCQVEFLHAWYPDGVTRNGFDLLVVPLSFTGDREAQYAHPRAPAVIVHDWIWRSRGISRVVSVLLLKRVNLIRA
jgi:hypothetical protein